MSRPEILNRLREVTAKEHQALERSLDLMSPTLSLEDYVNNLQIFHGFIHPWETLALDRCPPHLVKMFVARLRSTKLENDLRHFDAKVPDRAARVPDITNMASFWGSMYVIEGSTLGGQIISRHLEDVLSLRDGIGYSFFRGHGEATSLMWRDFMNLFGEETLDLSFEEIAQAASSTFIAFREWIEDRR